MTGFTKHIAGHRAEVVRCGRREAAAGAFPDAIGTDNPSKNAILTVVTGRLQLLLVLVLGSACFSPTYQEGLACSESGACPGELQCISNVCLLPGADGGNAAADASPGQADADDTPGIDADLCSSGSQTIEASGAIVDFVVPPCVTSLTIEVFGAEGGSGDAAAVLGGKGARMKGDFAVTEGETLSVLVGLRGLAAIELDNIIAEQGGGTGGGGSFVVASNGDAMVIAGGGGGATHINSVGPFLLPGLDADVGTSGGTPGGAVPGVGGADGAGGGSNGNPGYHGGTGGGGFLSAGTSPSVGDTALYGTPNNPGSSYAEGGAGGIGGSKGRNGGFGGGGSSGFSGGGGGGYSGGGGGGTILTGTPTGGGGGGSFNAGTNPDNSAGAHIGDGQVIMTWVVP